MVVEGAIVVKGQKRGKLGKVGILCKVSKYDEKINTQHTQLTQYTQYFCCLLPCLFYLHLNRIMNHRMPRIIHNFQDEAVAKA